MPDEVRLASSLPTIPHSFELHTRMAVARPGGCTHGDGCRTVWIGLGLPRHRLEAARARRNTGTLRVAPRRACLAVVSRYQGPRIMAPPQQRQGPWVAYPPGLQ